MKNKILQISLSLVFLILIQDVANAHASYAKRNQCRWWLTQYKAKAVVNGPSCSKQKDVDRKCGGSAYAHELIYRQYDASLNPLCMCQTGLSYWKGAEAEASASSTTGFAWAWKNSQCSNYKAGGQISNKNHSVNSVFEGDVKSSIHSDIFTFNYLGNSIVLNDLTGFLEINSEDFINEYATMQIKISIITTLDSGLTESEAVLFQSQASLINGILTISGDAGGFTSSDFTLQTLQHGLKYTLSGENKVIQLNENIDSTMIIEVELSVDVGNVLEGNSELNSSDYILTTSLNTEKEIIYLDIESTLETKGVIEIRDISGNVLYKSDALDFTSAKKKRLEIAFNELNGKDKLYAAILKLDKIGAVTTSKIYLPK